MKNLIEKHARYYSARCNPVGQRNKMEAQHYGAKMAICSMEGLTKFSLFDLTTWSYVSLDSKYARLLCDDASVDTENGTGNLFYGSLHPDDLQQVCHAEEETYRLLAKMPPDVRSDYFLATPVRLRNGKGGYRHVMRRVIDFKPGRKGEPWLLLIAVDVLEEEAGNFKETPMLINRRTKELYRMPPGKPCTCEKLNLSERELQVMQLAGMGFTNKEISEKLFLSIHTVATHRKNAYRDFGTGNIRIIYMMLQLLGILD